MECKFNRIMLLIFVILITSIVVNGQSDCNSLVLSDAIEKFDLGKFDEVSRSLIPCLPYFKNDDDKFSARRLLAKTFLANDNPEQARDHIREMLQIRPDYQPNRSEESLAFMEMVDAIKEEKKKQTVVDLLVTTATKHVQLSSDAPATIYVRTHDQIIKRGYRNLVDLLEDIPEVEIQKNSISEFKNQVTFRGIAGTEKFIIMLDGIRITPSTGDPYTLGTNYSLANAKSVEVILGPASALYGVDAFSGVINIITLDEDADGLHVNTNYGRYGTTDNSIVGSVHTKDIGFMIAGQFYHSREPDLYNSYKNEFKWYNEKYLPEGLVDVNGQERQINTSVDQRKFEMPTTSYFINAKFNFGNFEIGGSRNSEKHSSSINVDPRYTLYTKDAFVATTFQSFYAKHLYKNEKWSIQSYIMSNGFVMDPETKFMNRYTEYRKGYKYQFSQSKKIEEQWEYNFTKATSLIIGASVEDLSALPKTADLPSRYNRKIPAADQNIYYINTDTVDSNGRSLKILQDFHYLNYQNYGALFQFYSKAIRFTELTVGGRFDYNTRFGSVFNPRVGLVVKPAEKIKLKLLYGTSFLAPCPWKAYSTFGSFDVMTNASGEVTGLSSPFFHIPNTDLKPERLTSMEGSLIIFPNKNFFFSIGGYFNQIGDLISIQSPQGSGEFKGVNVAYIEKAVNQGLAQIYGGNIQGSYQAKIGSCTLNWSASYTYTDGTIDNNPIVLAAKNTWKSTLDWTFENISTSIRFIHREKSNSTISDATQHYLTNRAFSVLNFFARYMLLHRDRFDLSVSLRINNVTNAHYYNVASGQDSFYATPQDPIRTDAGLSFNF